MGCTGSKDTETKPQNAPKPKDDKKAKKEEPKQENQQQEDSEPWASKPRTIAFIMKELNVSEESANKIYDRANKDGDSDMDPEEVKALIKMIDHANQELKPLFEKADANKSGKTTVTEATRILKEIYPNMSEKPMKKLFKKFDNGDGNIQYGEFIVFYHYLKDADTKFRPQFEKCDANNTGTVTLTEASTVLQESFPKLDERAIKGLLYKYDSGDAIVQYEEFILFHANLQMTRASLTKKFDTLDTNGDGEISRKTIMELVAKETGMDEDECKSLVYAEDGNNDGAISKAEFLDLWSRILS